jgi:hypothetical protein
VTSPLSDLTDFYLARFLSAFGIYGHGILLGLVLGIPWLIVASECLWIISAVGIFITGFGVFFGILLTILYVAYVKE